MKRAFTLIELLVVIAIIAILAAILFPVFAQAKAAAKKTSALSNQKQVGTSILIYMGDSDDYYPRQDDCVNKSSSLNTALNNMPFNPTGVGCTSAPWYFRNNHYSWQRWLMPYTKNEPIFEHPGRQRIDTDPPSNIRQWSDSGELMGGLAINLALTGATNTYNRSSTAPGRYRNSWLGGNQNSIPDVSGAMLLFDLSHPKINFAPVLVDGVNDPLPEQVVYPMAVREFWAHWFKVLNPAVCTHTSTWTMSDVTNQVDNRTVFANGIIVGFADSSAKFYPVDKFLSATPTAAEYGVAGNAAGAGCGNSSGVYFPGITPNRNINYPFWGLTGQ